MLKQVLSCVKHKNVPIKNIFHSKSGINAVNHVILQKTNLTYSCTRLFHLSNKTHHKLYIDNENTYAYKILPPLLEPHQITSTNNPVNTLQDFEEILRINYRKSNIATIVETFDKVLNFSISQNICLSDHRFDNLVDGLMDHCQNLNDQQIFHLLTLIKQFPECESNDSHNFHDIWSCLDDICCWKMTEWNLETKIEVALLWYKLNLAKLSDYVYEVINFLPKKINQLDKSRLLYVYFLINACRRKSIDFDFEHALAKQIKEYNIDELGVIAMAYFKSKTKIKLIPILDEMLRQVTEQAETVHEITLSAILKVVRLSQKHDIIPAMQKMLDRLVDQIPRLSNVACLHLALIGTTIQWKHDSTLTPATLRLMDDIENIRLKEIERILLVNAMFDFQPSPNRCLYDMCMQELHKPARRLEATKFNRSLPSALGFLALKGLYSHELSDVVLDEDYINEVYGKSPKCLPHNLFLLDRSIDIECEGYEGNRLGANKLYKGAKWLTDFVPTRDQYQRLTLADKFYLDVVDNTVDIVGDVNFIIRDHILPHFSRPDVVICRERASRKFVEPFGFENYILGDIKRATNTENYQWIALVILVPNTVVRGTNEPLGVMKMKIRQLKKIGYDPIFIPSDIYSALDPEEKRNYLAKKIS